jgi:DNA mismatch endonuclease (patch repair protein)
MEENVSLPELIVRSAIPVRFGEFQTNQRDLPGTPDIVFRDKKVALFIHGCYWHRHRGCQLASFPAQDVQRWLKTFNTTVRRDADAIHKLKAAGWKYRIFWECEITSDLKNLLSELEEILEP